MRGVKNLWIDRIETGRSRTD